MKIRLLGPIEVLGEGGDTLQLPPVQTRLLARLALSANQVVSVDRLADDLWDGIPPATATTALRTHVSRLRKSLGDDSRIVTASPGYRLRLEPAESDLAAFAEAVGQARRHAADGDNDAAATAFAEALALWRGPALADVADCSWARSEAARLEEERLSALEQRVEADLAAGRHDVLAGELEALCGSHPLRERLWAARMVALYRSGRQADALRAFQALRSIMGEELGIDPSPELVRLEAAVLAQDPSLDLVAGPAPAPAASPAGLPSGVVTFLLTDIEGSTEAWESDAAAMDQALARHDALVEEHVTAADGVLLKAKGEGDATVSVFPRASAAVGGAVELQRALLAERWPASLRIRVRMAVHTGEARERNGDYFGPTLNRAARLRALADGGQIVLSGATAEVVTDLLPPECHLADFGTMSLRGVRRPERVFLVTGPGLDGPEGPVRTVAQLRGRPGRVPLAAAMSSVGGGMLVGREAEKARLLGLWEHAQRGERQFVLVEGEPGIGKSRLAAELAVLAFAQGATVLHGRCDEEMGLSYQPFVESLGTYVASLSDAALRRHVVEHGPDLARLLPELARRLGQALELDRAEPEAERYLMFEAVRAALGEASLPAPVLLVVDDLHWATDASLLLMRHVLRQDPLRLMVVALSRNTELGPTDPLAGFVADAFRLPGTHRMTLAGLDSDGVSDFLEANAGEALGDDAEGMVRVLEEETGGNPLFLGELIRHLADVGVIVRRDGKWRAGGDPRRAALPQGVRDVIAQRASRLSAPARRVVEVASVIGDGFGVDELLAAVVENDDEHLVNAIEEALRSSLVVERGEQLAFSHALVRKAVYLSLSSARRALLHQRVGEALESRPDFVGHLNALAHHYFESVSRVGADRASHWLIRAGHQQLTDLAFEEARQTFERAIAVLEDHHSADHARRADALLGLAHAKQAQGDVSGFKQVALEAADEARAAGSAERLADAAVIRAFHEPTGSPDPETRRLCGEALEAIDPADLVRRSQLLLSLAYAVLMESEAEEACALADEAIALAEAHAPVEVLGRAMYIRCVSLIGFASMEERVARADELLELSATHNDLRNRGYGLLIRAPLHMAVGDEAGFLTCLKEQEELAHATREWYLLANTSQLWAAYALLQGRFEEASDRVSEMLSYSSEQDFISVFTGQSFITHWCQGRLEQLEPIAKAALEATPMIGTAHRAAWTLTVAELGRIDEARAEYELLAADNFAVIPRDTVWACTIGVMADVCVLLDDVERAPALYQLLADRSGQLISIAAAAGFYASADRLLGMLSALEGDVDRATSHFEGALDLERRVGALPMVARTLLWYARAVRHRDLDHAALLAAESQKIAEQLGMVVVEAQARELAEGGG